MKLAEESQSKEFIEGIVTDLKASKKLPHYARVMLKMKSGESADPEDDKHRPKDQIDEEDDEVDGDGDGEHDYSSCKKCLVVLSQ